MSTSPSATTSTTDTATSGTTTDTSTTTDPTGTTTATATDTSSTTPGSSGGMGGTPNDGAGGDTGAGGSGAGGSGAGGSGAGGVAGGAGGSGGDLGAGGDSTGAGGSAGDAGLEDPAPEAPEMLSETGLYAERGADGELVLAEGVREFEPRYWLWSDGSDKRRYIYLPPDTQINTYDPDHWVFPVGTKFWKSFISADQLVETRLIWRTGEGENDWLFATYFWMSADATDAIKMDYKNLLLNAAGTDHDIPNGIMCERCHGALKDRALGFSALQLNHDRGGLDLATLMDEGLITDPISLDIGMPGDDELTREALGYLHANCGNCHNDANGLPVENVPEPQMLLRVSVHDETLEDTDTFNTAVNQPTTASGELAIPYRIAGGSLDDSAVHFRMTQRMIEDQMPPIGTEIVDPDGLELIQSWVETLPPPSP